MSRKFKIPLVESAPERKEHIGHITTPIENDLERVQTILTQYGVIMINCRNDDNWRTLILPQGATKTLKDIEGDNSPSIISLPDGYRFEYIPPIFNSDKTYARFPEIALTEESQECEP